MQVKIHPPRKNFHPDRQGPPGSPFHKNGNTSNQKHDSEKISWEFFHHPDSSQGTANRPFTALRGTLYYLYKTHRLMAELAKLAILLALLCFIVPILLHVVFWVLAGAASGNPLPLIIFLVICLWAITR